MSNKKIAIFVEGETEAEFISKLLQEIAGQHNISITTEKYQGGKNTLRIATRLSQIIRTSAQYEAWIYISGTDNRVNSDMGDQSSSLIPSGFIKVIGLKDLRGDNRKLSDLPKMELASKVTERKCQPLSAHLIIAVMEIETWFLAETNHYKAIDTNLTKSKVIENISTLGFNPYEYDLTLRPEPAEDLHNLYSLVGKAYKKSANHRKRTINALDYLDIYCNLKNRIIKLGDLVNEIDSFLN